MPLVEIDIKWVSQPPIVAWFEFESNRSTVLTRKLNFPTHHSCSSLHAMERCWRNNNHVLSGSFWKPFLWNNVTEKWEEMKRNNLVLCQSITITFSWWEISILSLGSTTKALLFCPFLDYLFSSNWLFVRLRLLRNQQYSRQQPLYPGLSRIVIRITRLQPQPQAWHRKNHTMMIS